MSPYLHFYIQGKYPYSIVFVDRKDISVIVEINGITHTIGYFSENEIDNIVDRIINMMILLINNVYTS